MLAQWMRVFYSDNGVLTDYSLAAQNSDTIPLAITASQDYVYIGQYFPFNNAFFQLKTVNALPSISQVQYWNGKIWVNARDVIDGTKVSGASLARSGVIQFSPDREEQWNNVDDTTNSNAPSELSSLEIYDLYWMRFKWSADLSLTTELENIGYSFCTDEMLNAIDSELSNYLLPWGGAGKVNWIEQIMLASQHVIFDLKAKGFIVSPGNILRFDDVSLATCYRTLAIIYGRLGDPFRIRYQDALNSYAELISVKRFTFDANSNARVDKQEISSSVGGLVR
jgi:hypothetical protein